MIIYDKEKELLKAQKRALAAWINTTLGTMVVNPEDLMDKLSTGVILCRLARVIQRRAEEYHKYRLAGQHPSAAVMRFKYWENARSETFFARDNAEIFLKWSKKFGVRDAVLFESDGLVLQTQPRTVVLCLLELSRLAAKYGILLPPPIPITQSSLSMDGHDSDSDSCSMGSVPSPLMSPRHPYVKTDSTSSIGLRSPLQATSCSPTTSTPESPIFRSYATLPTRSTKRHESVGNGPTSPVSFQRATPTRQRSFTSSVRISYPSSSGPTVTNRRMYSSTSPTNRSTSTLASTSSRGSGSTSPATKRNPPSELHKRVMEVASLLCKDLTKIQRISDDRYSFGGKTVSLRIVRGNNVVVRLGGGWDTLEHFLSVTDLSYTPAIVRRPTTEYNWPKYQRDYRNVKSRYMTL